MESKSSELETTPATTNGASSFAPISFWRLASKELRETLRDRRTLITLFLMPLIVYPILSLLFQGFLASGLENNSAVSGVTTAENAVEGESEPFVFVFNDGDILKTLAPHLNRGFQNHWRIKAIHPEQTDPVPETSFNDTHMLMSVEPGRGLTVQRMVGQGIADVGIEIDNLEFDRGMLRPLNITLHYIKEDTRSIEAVRLFENILDSVIIGSYRDVLNFRRIPGVVPPVSYIAKTVSPPPSSKKAGISFAALIPLILTLMTITGAVYPAIDLTAGERERGTLESMIAAPVPRMRILLGKLVAIVSVAMLTALVNLIGMSITLWVFQFDRALFGEQGLTLITVGRILGLLMLFAIFFSSVLLVITSFARSFKEGQAYLIPVMMVALAPSLMSLKPDLELAGLWTVTPLVNIVLLARDVLNDAAVWKNAVVTVGTTILYSILAITMAARFFGTAKVLYGMDQGIGSLFKRPRETRTAASASLALLCLALLFPASFIWQGVMARTASAGATNLSMADAGSNDMVSADLVQLQLRLAALGLVLVFLVVPLLLAAFHRIRLIEGFGLTRTPILAIAAGIFMGVGFGPLLVQGIAWSAEFLESFGISDQALSDALVQRGEQHVAQLKNAPFWLVLFSMAIVPAICEELFFRGFLFRAFRATLSPWKTILSTALLFGSFHLISASGLTLSRLVPTTIMGVVLGWVCYRSGSVIPGILLHGLHNAMTVGFAFFRDEMVAREWIVKDQSSVPMQVLLAGVICASIGWLILIFLKRPTPPKDPEQTTPIPSDHESTTEQRT